MKLTVKNNLGQEFEYTTEEFSGYDVFCEARERWGFDWETYTVTNGSQVIENVINPDYLEPVNVH